MAKDEAQRRSMVRMDDVIDIAHRPVSEHELEPLSQQIITRSTGGGALDSVASIIDAAGRTIDPNAPTWKAISLLDRKLDYLISLLQTQATSQQETEFYRADVNISGSGVRFPSRQLYNKDAHVWVAMIFPASPAFRVEAIGQVTRIARSVRTRDATPTVQVGVRFVAINEQDSEQILRYVFQKQREVLRAKQRDA